jgi:hypothetical protein
MNKATRQQRNKAPNVERREPDGTGRTGVSQRDARLRCLSLDCAGRDAMYLGPDPLLYILPFDVTTVIPNDIDACDGRYGVEDMRQAVTEARLQGLSPFCLTIDRQAAS